MQTNGAREVIHVFKEFFHIKLEFTKCLPSFYYCIAVRLRLKAMATKFVGL